MKRYLTYVAIFALLVIIGLASVETALLFVSNEYSYKRHYVETHGDRIKVLVLGHSHTGNGIMASAIGDSVFNMATQGRQTYFDAALLERYAAALPELECVVWPLGYDFQYGSSVNVVPERESKAARSYRCMFSKYMDLDYPGYYKWQSWSEIMNSSFNYVSRFYTRDFESLNQCDSSGYELADIAARPNGWECIHVPIDFNRDSPEARAAFDENLGYMRRIAGVCRDRGVRLVVVTMPCHTTYNDLTTPRGLSEMARCVDEMRDTYPAMEYYNFINDKRFVDEDFFNSSHLSNVGARKFAEIFKREVLAGDVPAAR